MTLRYLLSKYQDQSFYLVFDFNIEKTRPSLVAAVQSFVRERCPGVGIQSQTVLLFFSG